MNKYYKQISENNNKFLLENLNYIDEINMSNPSIDYLKSSKNKIIDRITKLQENQILSVCEIGFGCGFNFLTIIDIWSKTTKAYGCKLSYFSIEKHPISQKQLQNIHSQLKVTNNYAKLLLSQYYLLLQGYHRINIAKDITLTLAIGDYSDKLKDLNFSFDIWFVNYLNSYPDYFNYINKNSQKNASAISYSSNHLCNLLNSTSTKQIEEISENKFICHEILELANKSYQIKQPQLARPKINHTQNIAIIGAGISGATTAFSLASRGYNVFVYEKNLAPALEASGNYQGMLYGSWSSFNNPMMELSSSAYRYAHYLITSLLEKYLEYNESGIIQLSHNQQQLIRNTQLLNTNFPPEFIQSLSHKEIEQISGNKLNINTSGIFFPKGLWLNPPSLVHKLLMHDERIKLLNNCEIKHFDYNNDSWFLYDSDGNLINQVSTVIVCNSFAANKFSQLKNLSIRKIRGQITLVQKPNNLKSVICGDGYITPHLNSLYTIGATFQFNDDDHLVRNEDHYANIDNFYDILPDTIQNIDQLSLSGQTSFRASPYDYLPYVGPIAKYDEFQYDFKKLAKDKNARFNIECNYYPNLFVNIGHGAKGMLTAPLCGEIIADYIENTIMSCSETLRKALHPNRLYIRELVKSNKIE